MQHRVIAGYRHLSRADITDHAGRVSPMTRARVGEPEH